MNIDNSTTNENFNWNKRKISIPNSVPGIVLDFLLKESSIAQENKKLLKKLEEFAAEAENTRKLDPVLILRSKWAIRDNDSYNDIEFHRLKSEINNSNANVQPIKVRPMAERNGHYEIVFGHRRDQACLELGLPVLSMIESLNDRKLFIQMERENRERKNLRPYEQGLMYTRALDAGLFLLQPIHTFYLLIPQHFSI